MKLLWFHLMPYTDLPEDFVERYGSVWVDIDPSLFDPVRGHALYNEFMDELEFAAEVGFGGLCANEHHSDGRHGLMPSPKLIAASLARRTRDARLHLGWTPRRGLPGRHADGYLLRVRPEPEPTSRALFRSA